MHRPLAAITSLLLVLVQLAGLAAAGRTLCLPLRACDHEHEREHRATPHHSCCEAPHRTAPADSGATDAGGEPCGCRLHLTIPALAGAIGAGKSTGRCGDAAAPAAAPAVHPLPAFAAAPPRPGLLSANVESRAGPPREVRASIRATRLLT